MTTLSTFFRKMTAREPAPAPVPAVTLTERRAVLDELTRVNAHHASAVQRSTAQLAEADAQIERARDLLRDAEVARAEIQREALTASGQHGVTVSRLEARLRVGAPEILNVFIAEIAEQEDAARARGVLQTDERPGREIAGAQVPGQFFSNAGSITKRLEALRHARRIAEDLKLAAIPEPELRARLEKIRDEIPVIEGLLVDAAPLLTRAEQRELEWRGASA
jgi:septation ring formation regulator EzrA